MSEAVGEHVVDDSYDHIPHSCILGRDSSNVTAEVKTAFLATTTWKRT